MITFAGNAIVRIVCYQVVVNLAVVKREIARAASCVVPVHEVVMNIAVSDFATFGLT